MVTRLMQMGERGGGECGWVSAGVSESVRKGSREEAGRQISTEKTDKQ